MKNSFKIKGTKTLVTNDKVIVVKVVLDTAAGLVEGIGKARRHQEDKADENYGYRLAKARAVVKAVKEYRRLAKYYLKMLKIEYDQALEIANKASQDVERAKAYVEDILMEDKLKDLQDWYVNELFSEDIPGVITGEKNEARHAEYVKLEDLLKKADEECSCKCKEKKLPNSYNFEIDSCLADAIEDKELIIDYIINQLEGKFNEDPTCFNWEVLDDGTLHVSDIKWKKVSRNSK